MCGTAARARRIEADRGEHVCVHGGKDLIVIDVEGATSRWPAGVGDDDVDASPSGDCCVDQLCRNSWVGDVARNHDGVRHGRGELLQCAGIAGVEDELGSFGSEGLRAGTSEAFGGCSDGSDAPCQPEVHQATPFIVR